MKMTKLGLVAALVLGGIVASANLASAQQDNTAGKKGGRMTVEQQLSHMKEMLSLTDDQTPKVKAVLEDISKKRQELRDLAPEQRREKGQALREEESKKMKEILTADQFTKWQDMTKKKGPPPGEKKGEEKKADEKKAN